MNQERREFRRAVYASVVASLVVVAFIQPILGAISNWLLRLTKSAFAGLNDEFYQSAALGHRNDLLVFFLTVLLTPFIATMAFQLLRPLMHSRLVGGGATRFFAVMRYVFPIIGLVGGLVILASAYTDLQLNTSFNQRLTVLAPKLSDAELKELRAAWANMGGAADYERIQDRLLSLARSRGVSLPPPLPGAK